MTALIKHQKTVKKTKCSIQDHTTGLDLVEGKTIYAFGKNHSVLRCSRCSNEFFNSTDGKEHLFQISKKKEGE